MKRLIIILVIIHSFLYFLSRAQEKVVFTNHQISLSIKEIDSVIVRTLDWNVISFGYLGYNRKAFDSAFNYVLNDSCLRKNTSISCIKIKDETSLSSLIAVLNSLQPSTQQNPSSNEIMAKSEDFTLDNYVMVGYAKNEDPIEVRGQIKIYFKNQSVGVGYFSKALLDYNNIRYLAAPFSRFVTHFEKEDIK